ncbi:DUF302 domain-containing protein [Helicobacter sp. 13S00477-4]|uniref:DUF302 domain-containing protein n=1 Tax=Helicobacter sp. 13S00477-4 TaxID=1905759 RepID=UPI000BA4F0BD|nr:DUF302 domain-containing protein [Helicobacter sp. 13S00477-4]PAF51256.1 hypothetical protein BKH44_05995 [Helicobacter sp. 13S00477-4]
MRKFVSVALVLGSFAFAHPIQEVDKMKDLQVAPASIAKYNPKYLSLKLSKYDFTTTMQRAKNLIEQKKIKLFSILDHSAAAKEFNKILPPTSVIVFGNPAVGTQTMTKFPNVAMVLPMKVLVYERDGKVFVGYIKPSTYAKDLGFSKEEENMFIKDMDKSYEDFTNYLVQ